MAAAQCWILLDLEVCLQYANFEPFVDGLAETNQESFDSHFQSLAYVKLKLFGGKQRRLSQAR